MYPELNSSVNRALRRRVAGGVLACMAGLCLPAGAQAMHAQPQLERKVKAAFLYKFLGYADFPPQAFADDHAPLTIGVVGADDVAAELTRVAAGRTVRNRGIVVRPLREGDGAVPVHLLFVGGHDPEQVGRIVRQASGAMLVVTDCEDGLRQGSAINFRVVGERVRFDVAPDAAERNGIKLSSRLLTVAHRVRKGGE